MIRSSGFPVTTSPAPPPAPRGPSMDTVWWRNNEETERRQIKQDPGLAGSLRVSGPRGARQQGSE